MASNLVNRATNGLHYLENDQPPKLFKKSKATDITFLVEGKELHFAKYPLTEGSDIFTQMIENSADPTVLQLDDVAYNHMIMFLECLHPKTFQSITDTTLEPVLSTAHRFGHAGVKKRCEDYIIQQFNSQGNPPDGMYPQFFFHLQVAERYEMEDAVQVGVSSERVKKAYFSASNQGILSLIHHPKGYKDDENFQQLSFRTKFLILSTRLTTAEAAMDLEDMYLETKKHIF
ncbi:hypothetical protein ACJMK2_003226 [Sinanodonta woodiana]|uniref:BTB domain-containing protein n=1 Tax=Sinanodonta woodiana TaxID=1069815 RepID=A0ABD3XXK6_SINWO